MKHYKLNDRTKEVVECDLFEWAKWYETAKRHVADDAVIGDVRVSTVFLGIDHSFGFGPPQLFETMIFGGEYNEWQNRYTTWEQAENGHREAIAMVTFAHN